MLNRRDVNGHSCLIFFILQETLLIFHLGIMYIIDFWYISFLTNAFRFFFMNSFCFSSQAFSELIGKIVRLSSFNLLIKRAGYIAYKLQIHSCPAL